MGVVERRQRERRERSETILAAAQDVFLEKGIASATMEDIARHAELSKGTLYLYFESKDELYLAVALRALEELLAELESVQAQVSTLSGFAQVRALLNAYARFASLHRDRFRVAMAWLTSPYSVNDESARFEEYRRLVGEAFRFGIDALELGKRDGSIRPELDATQFAFQLWGSTVGILMLQASADEVARRLPAPVDFDDLLRAHLELVLAGIEVH